MDDLDGVKARAAERRRRIVSHVATSHADAEAWDLEFWQRQTPQQRLSALVAIHRDVEKARRSGDETEGGDGRDR